MAAVRLLALVVLVGCTREHAVDFKLLLSPTCSCAGPSAVSLAPGAKIGFFVRDGAAVVDEACLEIETGATNAEEVLPGALGAVDVSGLEGKRSFLLRVARPSAQVACEVNGSNGAPIILHGSSEAAEVSGDPITIVLDCSADACP
jgi:hypothetical protein